MSLWDNIKNWFKRAGTWIKNQFSSWDTYTDTVVNDVTNNNKQETLNEQINNWNITNTTTTNNTTMQNSGFDILKEKLNEQPTPIDTNTIQQNTNKWIEDKEEEWTLLKAINRTKSLWNDITDIWTSVADWVETKEGNIRRNYIVNKAYDKWEQHLAIWYNPDNKDVYFLDLNEDRWLFDWDWGADKNSWVTGKFEQLYSEALIEWERTWDYSQAFDDFYDKAKNLFRIRPDDYYWSPFRNGINRRKNMFTQDELDSLSRMTKADKWAYEPSKDEFLQYVSMYNNNRELQEELWALSNKYNPKAEELEIEQWNKSEWMSSMRSESLRDIDSYLTFMNNVNPNAATKVELTYSSEVLGDQLWRWYAQVAPIYRAEQNVLSRDKSTWSWYDKHILEQADIARQLDKQFASNLNDLFRQIVKYWVDSNWDIVNTPDIFENWESLNEVLTRWLREIAWENYKWYAHHQSHLDIIKNFANEAMYMYNQDKGWPLIKAWNNFEYFIEPVGSTLWEAWQAIFWTTLSVLGAWLDSEYMDQDSTVFRLLETDDSNIKRTIKRYYLKGIEYTPEVLWNLVPDVFAMVATWGGAVWTLLRHVDDLGTAVKVARAAEWASLLNKLSYINRLGRWIDAIKELWVAANRFEEIINAAKNISKWWKAFQRLKTWAQLVDRMTTELALWQFMDAQWSAYDTEPYSQASFLMSVIWSWLFDILPHASRLFTWKRWWELLKWDSIWSLAKYIDSSPEAVENIAKVLRKWTKEIWVDDLQAFVKDFWIIEDAAKQAYTRLLPEQREAIWKLTKWMVYSYINQAFGSNSTMAKRVRQILANENSNIADVVKYVAWIQWDVSVWPYVSTIRLKNGTKANIYATSKQWEYSPILDSIFNWWFDSRVKNWFSQADLDILSDVKWYSDIEKNKSKWFYSVTTEGKWTTYYLTEDWLKHFWLKPENITLESLWVTLKEAGDTREALQKIKWAKWVNISDKAIDNLAETWAYDEITSKVKEVLWC